MIFGIIGPINDTGCNLKLLSCESIHYGKTIVAVVIKLIHKMHRDVNGIA